MQTSRRAVTRDLVGAVCAALLTIGFGLGLLWSNPGTFFNDDYQVSILPTFADIARSWQEGHWPLLCSSSWACGNLAGEYQYGTFSVFINALVVAVWRLPLTYPQQAAALSITHLAVLAAGAYLLARERRLSWALATTVALAASINGWVMGWGATDWFGALAADAWLPWCWWAFEVALRPARDGGARGERFRFLLPVPFIYLLIAAGFPYTVVRLGLVTVWLAARTWWQDARGWRAVFPLVTGWALGLMWSAPAWWSLLDAMHGSGRSEHGVGVGNLAWTVPLASLPGLILPNWTVHWADFGNHPCLHPGLELIGSFVPTVGLVAGLTTWRWRLVRRLRWELGLLGVVLLLCLLPSPGLFRWSFRWLPLFHLVLALSGGLALQKLAATARDWKEVWQNPGAWAAGCTVLTWAALKVFHTANPDAHTAGLPPFTLAVAVGWTALTAAALWWQRRAWLLAVSLLATVASLAGSYTFLHTNSGLPVYRVDVNLQSLAPFTRDRLYLSLYREPDQFYRDWQVPTGFGAVVRLGSTGMFAGVPMVNGYSPIMSAEVGKRFAMETHGNVPEFAGVELLRKEAGPDGLLARLGVDGLILTHDYQTDVRPPAAEWDLEHDFDEGSVYLRRGRPLGDVRSWASAEPGEPPLYAPANLLVVESSRQSVAVDVDVPTGGAPALLAFRRPYFPGYRASLNGVALPVSSFQKLLPTVEVPAGSHGRLRLIYRPRAVVWGTAVASLGLLASAGAMGWAWRARG